MFSDNIVRMRKNKGLTQVGFAKSLHVTQSAISHWESGRSVPDAIQMRRIAEFFGVTVDDLMMDIPREPVDTVKVEQKPAPKIDIMYRSDIPNYLEKLNPKNRALLEEMARKLFELQQQEEKNKPPRDDL